MPKTPEQIQAELEAVNGERPEGSEGSSRTAEGLKVPNPSRGEFFGNLAKIAEPPQSGGEDED